MRALTLCILLLAAAPATRATAASFADLSLELRPKRLSALPWTTAPLRLVVRNDGDAAVRIPSLRPEDGFLQLELRRTGESSSVRLYRLAEPKLGEGLEGAVPVLLDPGSEVAVELRVGLDWSQGNLARQHHLDRPGPLELLVRLGDAGSPRSVSASATIEVTAPTRPGDLAALAAARASSDPAAVLGHRPPRSADTVAECRRLAGLDSAYAPLARTCLARAALEGLGRPLDPQAARKEVLELLDRGVLVPPRLIEHAAEAAWTSGDPVAIARRSELAELARRAGGEPMR